MAVTFQQYPNNQSLPIITNWTPMIGYMVYSDDDNSSFFYQKLLLTVRLGTSTGTIIAQLKQRRNGYSVDITNNNARAFFDLREIANSQTTDTYFDQNCTGAPFQSIHGLGASTGDNASGDILSEKIFSLNGNRQTGVAQVVTLYVACGQEYSTDVAEAPLSSFASGENDTRTYLQATLPCID